MPKLIMKTRNLWSSEVLDVRGRPLAVLVFETESLPLDRQTARHRTSRTLAIAIAAAVDCANIGIVKLVCRPLRSILTIRLPTNFCIAIIGS